MSAQDRAVQISDLRLLPIIHDVERSKRTGRSMAEGYGVPRRSDGLHLASRDTA